MRLKPLTVQSNVASKDHESESKKKTSAKSEERGAVRKFDRKRLSQSEKRAMIEEIKKDEIVTKTKNRVKNMNRVRSSMPENLPVKNKSVNFRSQNYSQMKVDAENTAKELARINTKADAKASNNEQSGPNKEVKKTKPKLDRPSDVNKNDPNAPETRGKLKDLLSSGGFNFNPKEREALSKILEKE